MITDSDVALVPRGRRFHRQRMPAFVVMVAALACLVLVVTLRDRLLALLADHALSVELASTDTRPTVWGGVAIGGAAAAALAAGAAAGPRPLLPRRRVRAGPVPIETTATETPLDVPPRGPLAAPRDDVG